ncbi:GNAT family N-acetyltransferase [Rhodobacterales bacterium HKCCE3408]|nr:GNAT family N-acetyltransferase [Rhodobacterales bacterium HKCCE3408]
MIRRLGPADWAAFRDIRLTMLATDPSAYGSTLADWQAKPRGEIENWLTNLNCFGAMDGDRCLSTATWTRLEGRTVAHRGEVIAVYTRSEARGRGLMAALLDTLAQDAAAAGLLQLELDVAVTGTAARAAYAAAGFTEVGRMPRGLAHGGRYIDKITMVRPLDTAG